MKVEHRFASQRIDRGKIFRRVTKMGKTLGEGMTEKAVWHIVKDCAKQIGISKLAPHDHRRTCARLCQAPGGELEQIQFLLGQHVHPDDGALSWLQAADSIRRQRSNWNRARSFSWQAVAAADGNLKTVVAFR